MSKPSVRQERILAILRSRGPFRVAELAREFDVSPITLRRDVEALARDEYVVCRPRGGPVAHRATATARWRCPPTTSWC